MAKSEVITNNTPRDMIDAAQLTATEREDFDYLDWEAIDAGRDSASFIRFSGELMDLGTFERTAVPGWDGQQVDTFFSATLVRYVDDGERVIIGHIYS